MRLLGLDIGQSRIGVSVSDEDGMIATPLTTLDAQVGVNKIIARIGEIVLEYGVKTIVVGMPLTLQGEDKGQSARMVRRLGDKITSHLEVRVTYWDERFSSVAAERALIDGGMSRAKRRKLVDKIAATLILQSYLDNSTGHD
jgi:putative Holliday junction resolvase